MHVNMPHMNATVSYITDSTSQSKATCDPGYNVLATAYVVNFTQLLPNIYSFVSVSIILLFLVWDELIASAEILQWCGILQR